MLLHSSGRLCLKLLCESTDTCRNTLFPGCYFCTVPPGLFIPFPEGKEDSQPPAWNPPVAASGDVCFRGCFFPAVCRPPRRQCVYLPSSLSAPVPPLPLSPFARPALAPLWPPGGGGGAALVDSAWGKRPVRRWFAAMRSERETQWKRINSLVLSHTNQAVRFNNYVFEIYVTLSSNCCRALVFKSCRALPRWEFSLQFPCTVYSQMEESMAIQMDSGRPQTVIQRQKARSSCG